MYTLIFFNIVPPLLVAYLGYLLRWQTWERIKYPYSKGAAEQSRSYLMITKIVPIMTAAACALYMVLQPNPALNPTQSYQIPMVIFGVDGDWDFVPASVTIFSILELFGMPFKLISGFTMSNVYFKPVNMLVLIAVVPSIFLILRHQKKQKGEAQIRIKTGLVPMVLMQIVGIVLFVMATIPTIIALGISLIIGGVLAAAIIVPGIAMLWFFTRAQRSGFRIF